MERPLGPPEALVQGTGWPWRRRRRWGRRWGGAAGAMFGGATGIDGTRPRVIMQVPANAADMLLSGTLANGEALANRAQLVDAPIGKGHVVMFAIRPFWRWQTQGTYFLGLNAILTWNNWTRGK